MCAEPTYTPSLHFFAASDWSDHFADVHQDGCGCRYLHLGGAQDRPSPAHSRALAFAKPPEFTCTSCASCRPPPADAVGECASAEQRSGARERGGAHKPASLFLELVEQTMAPRDAFPCHLRLSGVTRSVSFVVSTRAVLSMYSSSFTCKRRFRLVVEHRRVSGLL